MIKMDLTHRVVHGLVRSVENSLWTTMYTKAIHMKVSHGFAIVAGPCLIDNPDFLTATALGSVQNAVIEMERQRTILRREAMAWNAPNAVLI